MAVVANKDQHFVPKAHLRNFSPSSDKKSVRIFNFSRGFIDRPASIRGQCQKPWFYGKNLNNERFYCAIEGKYSKIVSRIFAGSPMMSMQEEQFLRAFTLLQRYRTEASARTSHALSESLSNALSEFVSRTSMPVDEAAKMQNEIMSQSLSMYEIHDTVIRGLPSYLNNSEDLTLAVIKNSSGVGFISSDNPSVMINSLAFRSKKLRDSLAGIDCPGVCILMPISPEYAVALADPGVYKFDLTEDGFATTSKKSDVDQINLLQVASADKNLYFREENSVRRIEKYISDLRAKNSHRGQFQICKIQRDEKFGLPERVVALSGVEEAGSDKIEFRVGTELIDYCEWPNVIKRVSSPDLGLRVNRRISIRSRNPEWVLQRIEDRMPIEFLI